MTKTTMAVLLGGAVWLAAGAATAADPPRLTHGKHTQAAGQSDYDFAKRLAPRGFNNLTLGDAGWEREEDRLDRQHEADVYKMFEWVAGQRRDKLAAYDLKLKFQGEIRDHWASYVRQMESLLAGVDGSKSLVDQTVAAEYRAAARKGDLNLRSAKQKLSSLEAEKERAARKP